MPLGESRKSQRTTGQFPQSTARLQQAPAAAVSTLLKVMVDPATPPAVKVRAADSILDRAFKGSEIEDLDVRITELERTASSKSTRTKGEGQR